MLNIAQVNPAVWSPPASGTNLVVAPVPAVAAVQPMQESARSGQSGAGREQGTPGGRTDAQEVARQGRNATSDGARNIAQRTGRGAVNVIMAQEEAKQNAKQLATEQAADEARSVQSQEFLVNVWKASAAAVEATLDRVLGPDQGTAFQQPTDQMDLLPSPMTPQEASSPADFPSPDEMVAYDDRGNGNLAPLEIGMLVSRRV